MISKGEQEIIRWVPYIQYTNLPKNDSIKSTTGEHVLLQFCCFMRVHLEFSEDRRKVPRNWDFSLFIKKRWVNRQKKNSQIQIWPIYLIGSFRILYSTCICTLAVVDRILPTPIFVQCLFAIYMYDHGQEKFTS